MLSGSATPDFLDSAHEWRRLFAETWGTFLLVVVAAGAGVVIVRFMVLIWTPPDVQGLLSVMIYR